MSALKLCIIMYMCFSIGVIAAHAGDLGSPGFTLAGALSCMVLLGMALGVSSSIEWSKQDAVNTATGTLLDEINERNVERAAMQRRIESLKRNLTRPRGEEE